MAFSLDDTHIEIPADIPDAPDIINDKERRELLAKLLGEENADIFYRHCVEGVPTKELASEYGVTDGSIRVRLSRIKKQILANRDLFFSIVLLFVLHFGSLRS